jgi:hypothetical protein
MSHGHQRWRLLFCVLTLLPAIANAQAGRLAGTIRGTDGAALPGITLVVTGPVLKEPRTVVTDAGGHFEVAGLPAGPVSVTCQALGFAEWRRDDIKIAPGGATTLNLVMRLNVDWVHNQITGFLSQLPEGSIAFNAPDSMLFGQSQEMRLLLSPELSVDAVKDKLRGMPGIIEGAVVRIAPQMEARLSGQSFDVNPITPERQVVARNEATEWRWEVTPKTTGSQRLFLALNVSIEGTSRTLRTFDRTIQVQVTLGQRFSGFVSNNWQWLWTTALVPLAGWLWKRRRSSGVRAARARR